MCGSDRNRPKDYKRAVVVDIGPKNTTNEDTHRNERRSTLINSLTEPALLEMSGNATTQELGAYITLTVRSRHPPCSQIPSTP
jgi:hypothetical protein